MKKILISLASFSALFAVSAMPSFAATFILMNGGLGQAVSNPQQFGVAVCNNSGQTLSAAVPVAVTVGSESATVSAPAPITAGNCQYAYVSYSQLGMQAGTTYTVSVVIDPQHTVSSNADATTYSATVPTQVAVGNNGSLTANAGAQLSNPLMAVWNWLVHLF